MNEEIYQQQVRELWTEMQDRANTAVDYLVTQPPIRLARLELYALLEWAFEAGAQQPAIVKERLRRRDLAKQQELREGQPNHQ